jgi:hypothetical protein
MRDLAGVGHMQSAIIYVVVPEGSRGTQQSAERLLAAIATLKGNEAVRQLGDFVWQVDFRSSPNGLALLVQACEQLGLPYGILPLSNEPQWICRNPGS